MPLASVDYSGGIIITDWYSTDKNSNESIKISIRFLQRMKLDLMALDIKVLQKEMYNSSNCITLEKLRII